MTGSLFPFGGFEWRLLALQDRRALLISEYILEQRPYHDAYIETTWADCSLRRYLNGTFFDRFSEADHAAVLPVLNKNDDNQWYGTKGGEDTLDRIFLLSLEEACTCFGDSRDKLFHPKLNQRYWFERKDENNVNRMAGRQGEGWSWWWLRSPGRVGVKAVYIHGDGNIGIQGNNILKGNIGDGRCIGGVRPALWVRLDALN